MPKDRSHKSSSSKKLSVFDRLGYKSASKRSAEKLLNAKASLESTSPLRHSSKKMKKSSHSKKSKEKNRKSQKGKVKDVSEPTTWLDAEDLEEADEKYLQKKRLQLQRALKLQLKKEKVSKRPKKERQYSESSSSSESSTSSSESESSSSSSSSSYTYKKSAKKRKASTSSRDSDSPIPEKKPKTTPKPKIVVKKVESPKKEVKKVPPKRSLTPEPPKRIAPIKLKSPVRLKPIPLSPKRKPKSPSPKRSSSSKDRRPSPPRVTRPRSPERRRKPSPRPRSVGLEKGGKIISVRSALEKESKEPPRTKTVEKGRDDHRERERSKERRRRDQREVERKEKVTEKVRRDEERSRDKERDDALSRSRDRFRDKRGKDYDRKESRISDLSSDLPSLLNIKTEVPRDREPVRRPREERPRDDRRIRRPEENFDYRRVPRDEPLPTQDRRPRKGGEFLRDVSHWEVKDSGPPPDWQMRDWKNRQYEGGKWGNEREREAGNWRERDHYAARRPPDYRNDPPPLLSSPQQQQQPPIERSVPEKTQLAESKRTENVPAPSVVCEDVEQGTGAGGATHLEEVLSDISDDPDDILNQVHESPEPPPNVIPTDVITTTLSQPSVDFFFDSRKPLLECLGDRGLDFEEISDEDLEEETKMGKGIMDVLGADWASLMAKNSLKTPKVETLSSARRRWRVDNIIKKIGISKRLAGGKFYNEVMDTIRQMEAGRKEDEEEQRDEKSDVKVEKQDDNNSLMSEAKEDTDNNCEVHIKKEPETEEVLSKTDETVQSATEEVEKKVKKEWTMLHSLPAVHAMLAQFTYLSPVTRVLHPKFRTALSARADLAMRRELCGMSAMEPVHPNSPCDEALRDEFIAIFKSAAA